MLECCLYACFRPVRARRFCAMHLRRFYRHGNPLTVLPTRGLRFKHCRRCRDARDKHLKEGLCKTCYMLTARERQAKYRKANPERYRRARKRHYWKHKLQGGTPT